MSDGSIAHGGETATAARKLDATAAVTPAAGKRPLGEGLVLAGAAKISINPAPDESAGEVWQTEGCATGVQPVEAANTENDHHRQEPGEAVRVRRPDGGAHLGVGRAHR